METVRITINGREVAAPKGELLIEACEMAGVYLPRFCHFRGLTPQASCRMCVVRVDNPKIPKLQTACTMPVTDGMVVTTESDEIESVRAGMIEFLLSNHPVDCPVCDRAGECELQDQTYGFGEDRIRSQYADKETTLEQQISPFIYNDPQRCVTCKRCTRVCEEWMDEFAITAIHRGSHTFIGSHSGWVECSDCGNCVDVCPTGTLLHVPYKYVARPWDLKQTPTVCNFCSDGCSLLAGSRSEELIRAVARDGRGRTAGGINPDFLCSLGRYPIDFVHSPARIDRPLIRRGDNLIPTTWDDALNYIAEKLGAIKAQHGGEAIGVISSGRLLNEDQYLLKKLAGEVLETKHAEFYHDDDEIDLAAFFRHGQPTLATQAHIQNGDVILLIGSDPNEENPLTAFSLRWAVRQKSARLLLVNAMPSRLERQAQLALRVRAGSESAIVAALLDETKINEAAEATGTQAEDIRAIRESVVNAERVIVVFGDELKGAAVAALALFESALATPDAEQAKAAKAAHLDALQRQSTSTNSGPKPSINDNPFLYIVPQPTLAVGAEAPVTETKFAFLPLVRYANSLGAWQMGMDSSQSGGLSAQAMVKGAGNKIRALYVAGEDVVAKWDDKVNAQLALSQLELLVVQDMFLSETAKIADVVLPTTSFAESQGTQTNNAAQVQLVRRVIPPVGQARPDWMIVNAIARLMGKDFGFQSAVKNVFREISEQISGYQGLSHNLLFTEGAVQVKADSSANSQPDRDDILDSLQSQTAKIKRNVAPVTGPLATKAGTRLQTRYPLLTRYSRNLPLDKVVSGELEENHLIVFPA